MEASRRKRYFHPYIRAMTPMVERWLCKKAAEGWKLFEKSGWSFTFLPAREQRREYFMYSSFGVERGLSYDFFRAKDRYAKAKSHINQTSNSIFEADPEKTDDEYYKYKADRDRYYRRNYLFLLFPQILILVSFALNYFNTKKPFFLYMLLLCALLVCYSLLSWLLLTFCKTKTK